VSSDDPTSANASAFKVVSGCGCLMLLPALLLAGTLYCGWLWFESQQETQRPAQPSPPAAKPLGRKSSTATATPGTEFTADEDREIQRQFENLSSPDYGVVTDGWRRLVPFHRKNPAALRDQLIARLRESTDRAFVTQACWGLCTHYGEEGKIAVVEAAVLRKEDPGLLTGIADAMGRLGQAYDQKDMKQRIRKALEASRSPFADRFAP